MYIILLTYNRYDSLSHFEPFLPEHVSFLNESFEKNYFLVSDQKYTNCDAVLTSQLNFEVLISVLQKDPLNKKWLVTYKILETTPEWFNHKRLATKEFSYVTVKSVRETVAPEKIEIGPLFTALVSNTAKQHHHKAKKMADGLLVKEAPVKKILQPKKLHEVGLYQQPCRRNFFFKVPQAVSSIRLKDAQHPKKSKCIGFK